MNLKFDIDATKASGLEALTSEPLEALTRAASSLQERAALSRKSDIREALADHISDQSAEALSDMLTSFTAFSDAENVPLEKIFYSLVESARERLESSAIKRLEERIPTLIEMGRVPRVELIGKSLEIAEVLAPRLLKAKVYTMSAPIFDTTRQSVEGMIVTNKLRLSLVSASGTQEHVEVALTQKQLEKLQVELATALSKAKAYSAQLAKAEFSWVLGYYSGRGGS